jgi:restriction system protein
MKKYYRIMLGKKSVHAATCFAEGFIGVDDDLKTGDLSGQFHDDWRNFNKKYIPVFLSIYTDKSKIAAGLACGVTWTVCKGVSRGDIVICPDGTGVYRVGEVTGDYFYAPDGVLPHRRPVRWLTQSISRADMSESLKRSAGSIGTVSTITQYEGELERLIG